MQRRYDRGFVVLLVLGGIGILLVLAIPVAYTLLLWWSINYSSYSGGYP